MADNNQDKRKELEDHLKSMKVNAEHIEMMIRHSAERYWLAFGALKEQGFTETQALTILCRRGPFLS